MILQRRKHSDITIYMRILYLRKQGIRNHAKEVTPKQTRKIFQPNPEKIKLATVSEFKIPTVQTVRGPRVNKLDIQMLSETLRKQIFKDQFSLEDNHRLIEQCKKTLEKHGMVKNKETECLIDVDLQIPELLGSNLLEHFEIIGEQQVKPYKNLINTLLERIPNMPTTWLMQPGWTRYVPGSEPETVPFPLENGIIFDVEVCMQSGKAPTLATAVTHKAWYAWVSQSVLDGTGKPVTTHRYAEDSLIPFESSQNDFRIETSEHLKQETSERLKQKTSERLKQETSEHLKQTSESLKQETSEHLKQSKVVIGHNVSYDRARIKEQYWLEQTGTRFVDTMSLHVCVSGLTSYQRAVLKSGESNEEDEIWKGRSSLNSLSEVHKLYCGTEVEKETRNIFIEGSLADIKSDFQNVITYCAKDVVATYEILQKLFPLFLERFPHPVTFAGMLEMGTAYLPVNSNWDRYISNSEQTYEDLDIEGRFILARRADQACQLLHNEEYKEDVWMWDQDWKVKEIKLKNATVKRLKAQKNDSLENVEKTASSRKLEDEEDEEPDPLAEKFKYLEETRRLLPAVQTLLPGYPNWYRKLCTKPDSSPNWVPGPHLISTAMQVTPKLLGLTWEGYPLHFIRGQGWGLLVPFTDTEDPNRKLPLKQLLEKCPLPCAKPKEANASDTNIVKEVQENLSKREYYSRLRKDKTDGLYKGSGVWCNTILEECCWFFKLPHKDGISHRVGNPLAKDFLNKFSDNVLAGDTESAEKVLSIARMLSYWRNNRDRIMEQMVVWLENKGLPKNLQGSYEKYGAIVPQVVVCGTLTRRAMEPTWMTASNAYSERVGSELRAMVQAPPGYNIVGADVDSQELWIASLIGDAHFAKMHGATPLGWMTLSGNKADGTDMHSVTAKAVGISRDHAKVLNYARIYGAGQNFAERLLKQFNPTMSESEARSKANKMFTLTKGKRIYYLKQKYLLDFPDQAYGQWQAFELAKANGKTLEEMFMKPKWVGGTESAMFNQLEEIAGNPEPSTPFLQGRLSRALEPSSMPGDRFLPTRINWVVQSGAVDFLHLMLVCMRWIMGDKARFCLSFHDEVRYLVPTEYKYQAALAMHVTNLLTRSFCSMKLGINDLPQSVAFFSSVEVDTVLRKEAKQDCRTPSNPHGLSNGYGIPNGESLDIYEAVKKAKGSTAFWYKEKSYALIVTEMSRATKRKHVLLEVLQDDYSAPTENQQIVRVLSSRGNNLHEVEAPDGTTFLVSMPTKFRKNVWVKRGDYVLVEPIKEGDKVKAEMVRILTNEHVKYFKKDGVWPSAFDNNKDGEGQDDDLFVNTNRAHQETDSSSTCSSSDSESSDSSSDLDKH